MVFSFKDKIKISTFKTRKLYEKKQLLINFKLLGLLGWLVTVEEMW